MMMFLAVHMPVRDFLIRSGAQGHDLDREAQFLASQGMVHIQTDILIRDLIDARIHGVVALIAQFQFGADRERDVRRK